MNSSSTWTSKGRMRDLACSVPKPARTSHASSQVSLHLVQKTSGLFDTDKAGNIVAGKASKPGLDLLEMDPAIAMAPGDDLGELFQVMPSELTEADYLDSFMDLSNFLNTEELKETESVQLEIEGEDMKEIFTGFSDLHTLLNTQPATETVVEVAPSSVSPRKRKACEAFETKTVISDATVTGRPVCDHDYVSQKLKKRAVEAEGMPVPSTSKTAVTEKSPTKYRERRDKNNVASRRSRQIRKQKYVDMDQESERLKIANEKLREKIEDLESLAKVMKAELIKKMTEK